MPSLGADMESGTIVEWHVKPGDTVQRGDIIALVSTEKSDIEVEVFDSGAVREILVPVGQEVEVGTVLARLGDSTEPSVSPSSFIASAPDSSAPNSPPPIVPPSTPASVIPTPRPQPTGGRVVSPLIRHRAEELGVDLDHVLGSGPGGAIHRSDVERAAATGKPASGFVRASPRARRRASELGIDLSGLPGSGPGGSITEADVESTVPSEVVQPTVEPLAMPAVRDDSNQKAAMRRAIASLMERANREIPHYYLNTTIDLQPALDWLAATSIERPVAERIIPTAMLLKATALAAREVPDLNGFWAEDHVEQSGSVHLGVAISLRGGGLIAPAILDADKCTLVELMVRLRDLVSRARSGVLRSSEMSAPTITVSNLGDQGAEAVYGVIYPPQVALIGFGKIVERPWAHEGMLGVRSVVTATVAGDHRASDGHVGGLFLAAVDRLLQRPEEL